jgi:2-dehydropantoate 2-reductase
MLGDLERGRRLELPWLSGAMVRIAQDAGIPVPTHQLFVDLLKLHAGGHTAPAQEPRR